MFRSDVCQPVGSTFEKAWLRCGRWHSHGRDRDQRLNVSAGVYLVLRHGKQVVSGEFDRLKWRANELLRPIRIAKLQRYNLVARQKRFDVDLPAPGAGAARL